MIAPAKPMIADKASRAPRFRPLASAICPRPRMFTNTAMTINTAMLVATKRAIRFIDVCPILGDPTGPGPGEVSVAASQSHCALRGPGLNTNRLEPTLNQCKGNGTDIQV